MFKFGRIAQRLALNFGGMLLVFAVIVGVAFYQLFRNHTMEMREREMMAMAQRMAEVVSDNMDVLEFYHGSTIASSKLAAYLNNVVQEDVWLVDVNRNLSLPTAGNSRLKDNSVLRMSGLTPHEAYESLPKRIKEKVEEAFGGCKFVVSGYSVRAKDTVMTVGAPVVDRNARVRAVVLVHAPVEGMQAAVYNGIRILAFAIAIAFFLGLGLSGAAARYLAKPVMKMQKTAERLGNEDYSARCEIVQDDEIGELAETLDTLAVRLEKARKHREHLDNMRRQFISNATHELRTPLTVMLASIEALKLGVIEDKQEVAETYDSMYAEGMYAKTMISDLLELSKLQNPDFPLEMGDFDLVDCVTDAVQAAQKLALEKNISVGFEHDVTEMVLRGDRRRVRQMLLVFLTNALKFSNCDSTVEVALKEKNLTVTDHGCGMSQEQVEQCFDVFYSKHDERNKEGSGLGLSIGKSIAQRHGWDVYITSAEGIGTTVRINLQE